MKDISTPEEIEASVRRGCRGLPEAVVEINVAEALRELERMMIMSKQVVFVSPFNGAKVVIGKDTDPRNVAMCANLNIKEA